MKKFFNTTCYVSLLAMVLTFSACQEEFEELPTGDEQETIMASSSTAKLIERTSSKDGSYDNIIDEASCFAVQFPYTVNVNGVEVNIDSLEDLEVVEEIFDEVDIDDDILEILFPITITLADFTEIVINNKEELRELAEECIEGGDDDDIECIDFVYPITLFTFDINLEQTGNVSVNSDEELRRFFAGLDENDLISIEFPVTLKLYDGTEIVVDSNAELANAIETSKEACDEDDDDDFNDDDFEDGRLDFCLTACPWVVKEVVRDEVNQTDQYFEYVMNFFESGEVVVKDRMGNNIEGTWSTRATDNGPLLKLEFDVLVDFTLEWFVYEIEDHKIKLYAEGGNKIIMKQICVDDETGPDTLRAVLNECVWVIKKVKNQGEEIDRLLGYEFKFMPEGVVTLSNEETTSEGTWEITSSEEGRLVMAITMGDEPGVSFEWPLTDLRDDRLKFEVEDIDYELILQRVCEDNADDGDVLEIRNVMMDGEWIVALHQDGDDNDTADFAAYTFAFGAEHMITATLGETGPSSPGLWRVLRNSDGKLKVYLNLGDQNPLGELTDDWDFVSINEGRVELKDISGDDTITTLVFEKKQ
ncbi:hypothetical protein [Spongiimicrobium sp. 3-5]|uniref:hypothetical protein n=1 Tax=Spongiimicrobium sp. 3-5 TaxID=3332596 RepID=UPI003980B210